MYQYELFLERERIKDESAWARTRIIWADFRNANFKKKVKPEDLVKLSWDKKKDEKVVPMTHKEMKEMFGAKFKKINGN